MPLEDAFLADILEHPDDDAPRLVFADWLDDHGEAERAEFIRLQCELARLGEDDPRRPALTRREAGLLARHRRAWAAPAALGGASGPVFRRGFIEALDISAGLLLHQGERVFLRAPVREITLHDAVAYLHELARQPWLARLSALRILCAPPERLGGPLSVYRGFSALCRSPHLASLRVLDLPGCGLGPDGEFAACTRSLPGLAELGLPDNRLGFTALTRLVGPESVGLRALDLAGNAITDEGARWLAGQPGLRNLRWLRLEGCPIGDVGVTALLDSGHMSCLRRLTCDHGPLSNPVLARLRAWQEARG
jgi:uncharacterized protein (TIGR02996 family)